MSIPLLNRAARKEVILAMGKIARQHFEEFVSAQFSDCKYAIRSAS